LISCIVFATGLVLLLFRKDVKNLNEQNDKHGFEKVYGNELKTRTE